MDWRNDRIFFCKLTHFLTLETTNEEQSNTKCKHRQQKEHSSRRMHAHVGAVFASVPVFIAWGQVHEFSLIFITSP